MDLLSPARTIRIKSSSLKKTTGPITIVIQPEEERPKVLTKAQITKASAKVLSGAKQHPAVVKAVKKPQNSLHKRPVPRKATVTVKVAK